MSEILPAIANLVPDSPAILTNSGSISFHELYDNASRFAAALQKLGVQSGNRVALVGQTHQIIVAEHAAVALGAIPFSVNPSLEDTEVMAVIEDGDPVVCVCDVDGLARSAYHLASGRRLGYGLDDLYWRNYRKTARSNEYAQKCHALVDDGRE